MKKDHLKRKLIVTSLFNFFVSILYAMPFTHYTTDRLRLRSGDGLDSKIITVLEPNLGVEILEKGKKETIDNVSANWVKIKCANGYEGWCFSKYLLPIEKDAADKLASEVSNIKAGSYSERPNSKPLKNIQSVSEFNGKEGFYIQQNSRAFQGHGRAPEILQLMVQNGKVFVKEIDVRQGKTVILKESEFSYKKNTFCHNNSCIKIDENKQISIFYLENAPEQVWSGSFEYENPYTRVSGIDSAQLMSQTSDVLRNYEGTYKYDSYKIIKQENKKLQVKNIENVKIDITYNEAKKCLSAKYTNLRNVAAGNGGDRKSFDFIETSSTDPFYWTYAEGPGFEEEKLWFYKGGIAVSFECKECDFDDDFNVTEKRSLKYVVFLKKSK